MSELAFLVPVLNRPHRVKPLVEAVRATTPDARLLFICDPGDRAEQDAIAMAGGEMISPGGGYAAKINAGVRATCEPYVLLGADDVRPHRGWFETARSAMVGGVQVVGINDLIQRPDRPEHAPHFLLTRAAAELPCLDGRSGPLCEGYGAWWCDDELIATATKRGMYAYARDAVVEHVGHPMTGGPDDETYRRGRALARVDGRLFRKRMALWT